MGAVVEVAITHGTARQQEGGCVPTNKISEVTRALAEQRRELISFCWHDLR